MIMKNRVIKIFLTIMMVISILPIASKTAYADESGTPGNPWHIEELDGISVVTAWLTSDDINKTLHISGTGNMKNFGADDHPWKEDREKITTIVFEEEGSVTSIGNKAFVGCTALTRITIDSSVAHIGDNAFNGCSNLSTVIFRPAAENETLTIADKAFATNQKLAYGSASMMRLYDGGNAIQAKADLSDYNNKTLTWKAYSYHLSVGGVEVTDSNKDNIFEDSGTVRASYNPESNTLKLNGVNIQPDDNNPLYGIYYNGTDALNIYLESGSENIVGVNNFAYGFTYGIYSTENAKISFSGTGKLKVTAGNGGTCSGIFAKGDMEINGSTVTSAASGYYNNGIVAKNLTINGGTVVSSANDLGEYTTTHGISVDTLVINTGAELTAIGKAGAISGVVKNAIAGTGWEDTAGTEGRTTIWIKTEGQSLDGRIKKVQFPGVTVYPITISGVQVDSSNKDDILYGTENQGKVSYDPDTKTLTLNGAVITEPNPFGGSNYTECIYIDDDDLTINVASGTTNSIRSSSKVGSGIVCTGDLTINGNGTLNVTADGITDGAIVAYDLLSISEVNLSAEANNDAITGANGVSIRNATVTAASEKSKGIAVNDGKIIELGTNAVLTASGGNAALFGGVNIDGATVTATSTNGYGILANDEETIEIRANAVLTASGGNAALSGNVINAVNGIGWKDTGQVNIEISAAARKLDNDIKKVKFPAADPVARVTLSDGTAKVYTVFSTAVTEWKNANDATLKLLADVETSSNVNLEKASGTRVLDLNGYGILYTGTSGSVIFIDDGVSLTMTDGDPTRVHYITLDSSGRGKVVSDTSSEGAIEVNGGYITGGLGYSFFGRNGGGVYAGGPFTMEGGTIVGNTANPASSYG